MEIQYFGANCLKIFNKDVSLVIDDNLINLGLKSVANAQDIAIFTDGKHSHQSGHFIINGPGEYEIANVSIRGIPARSHLDNDGLHATVYTIKVNDYCIAVLGHIYPELNDEQLEKIGVVDVLIIPVGGNGYTVDADGAVELIKKIEPKLVVPTHYADNSIKYEVPQADLQVFLKAVGVSDPETQDVLILKNQEFSDKTKVIVLNRIK